MLSKLTLCNRAKVKYNQTHTTLTNPSTCLASIQNAILMLIQHKTSLNDLTAQSHFFRGQKFCSREMEVLGFYNSGARSAGASRNG